MIFPTNISPTRSSVILTHVYSVKAKVLLLSRQGTSYQSGYLDLVVCCIADVVFLILANNHNSEAHVCPLFFLTVEN